VVFDRNRRNSIFEALVAVGHDPRDFDLSDGQIVHPATGSSFAVGGFGSAFMVTSAVGDIEPVQQSEASWRTVLERLLRWVGEIEHYASTPDLWAELGNEREVVGLVSAPENAPFTDDERSEVLKQLQEIKGYLNTAVNLSDEQMQRIDEGILYLEEASQRLGRKDWLGIAVATVVNFAVQAVLQPSEVRTVFTLLQSLGHLFGHPFPELPPG
jgi:hypothetical protein